MHVKQAVAVPRSERAHTLVREVMVDATVVPESLRLDPLLSLLRGEGFQMAIVSDEYGGTAGVVTLEDVVEEIVGDIADEHDRYGSRLRQRPDGSWIVSGLLRPDEVADATGLAAPRGRGLRHRGRPARPRARPDPATRRPRCWCRCRWSSPRTTTRSRSRSTRCCASSGWTACGSTGISIKRLRPARRDRPGRPMSTQAAIWLGLVLLLGNAFFVGAEFALVSARRTKVEPKAAAGSRVARTTLRAMEELSQMIAAAQFGITVCSLGLGAVAEPALAHLIEPVAEAVNLPDAWLHPVAFTLAMAFVVYLHVVLGEMVPKNLALAGPERAAMVLGPPMVAIVTVLKPIVYGLDARGERRRPAAQGRAAHRGHLHLHPRGGRGDGRRVARRGHARRERVRAPRRRARLHLTHGRRTCCCRSTRSRPSPRRARATDVEAACARPATPASRWSATTASWSATCTSRTSSRPTRTAGPAWSRTSGSGRSPRCAPSDTLVRRCRPSRPKGAHMAPWSTRTATVVGVATLEDVIEELVGEIRDAAHAERLTDDRAAVQVVGRARPWSPTHSGQAEHDPVPRSPQRWPARDPAAVAFDDPLAHRQADAVAVVPAQRRGPGGRLEDLVALGGRDPDAFVGDGDLDVRRRHTCR